jgi:hypothetical protein
LIGRIVEVVEIVETVEVVKGVGVVALRPVGGWRSGPAGLEVGGKGKIIGDWGLKQRCQVSGVRRRADALRGWRLEERRFGRLRP